MRVISGTCRGRKLARLDGMTIRPTPDRVREAIFNILGPSIRGKNVLDLFAGSGALGIEALSRGAGQATFVDLSCDIVRQNLERCRLQEKALILEHDLSTGTAPGGIKCGLYDLIFMDPPYAKGLIPHILNQPWFMDLLAEECIIITEQSHKERLDFLPPVLDIYRQKKYSKTIISFLTKRID